MISFSIKCFAILLLAASCAGAEVSEKGAAKFQTRKTWSFAADGVSFSNEFSGARLNGVARTGDFQYCLTISPETRPINNSAWFAFRVWSKNIGKIRITLAYEGGNHRYRPQVSEEDGPWNRISDVTILNRRKQAVFLLDVSPTMRMVAGQPLITVDDQMTWSQQHTRLPFVRYREIGLSVQGRPVPMLESRTAQADRSRTLILMTGQHPPEFTSVVAFRNSIDTVFSDTPLARRFRRHFNVAVFPLMNPDGWHHGHWRCNANGIDPNRSWFANGMPEVPEVAHAIREIRALPSPVSFLDFHSTNKNVLYTGVDDDWEPRHLVPEFHAAMSRRVPKWLWSRQASHTPSSPVAGSGPPSRSWGSRELKIPTVTWEFSDIASRERLKEGTVAGTEELMRLMLRLVEDDTKPVMRFDFEVAGEPGKDTVGATSARVDGAPRQVPEAGYGKNALSLAPDGSSLSIPDFDYGAKGSTLAFWFRMDRDDLADGDATTLVSHGLSEGPDRIAIEHRKSASNLSVNVLSAGDVAKSTNILISDEKILDDRWHHLGVVITPGKGAVAFLDGKMQGKSAAGSNAINPAGPLLIGTDREGSSATRFKGMLDDVRIYQRSLSPYDLTTVRHPQAVFAN